MREFNARFRRKFLAAHAQRAGRRTGSSGKNHDSQGRGSAHCSSAAMDAINICDPRCMRVDRDVPAHAAPHLPGALAQARAITPPEGIIVATGSVFLVGELRALALYQE